MLLLLFSSKLCYLLFSFESKEIGPLAVLELNTVVSVRCNFSTEAEIYKSLMFGKKFLREILRNETFRDL
jgi:hypothetical protein